MTRSMTCLVGALATLGLSGCISWTSVPPAETAAPGATKVQASVALKTAYHAQVEGVKVTPAQEEKAATEIHEIMAEVLGKTNRFRIDAESSPPYRIEVDVTNSGDPNLGLAILSGVTLTIIPAWATDEYATEVRIFDPQQAELGRTTIVHEQTTLIQLLLLPATPFVFPTSVNKQMWRDVGARIITFTDATILKNPPKTAPPVAPPAPAEADAAPSSEPAPTPEVAPASVPGAPPESANP